MERTPGPCVAYYRVSTDKQGESGLGLEAQKKAVANYLVAFGRTLEKEFTEIESGRKCKKVDRPMLHEALALTRKIKGTLVIAKLDRLSRNLRFIAELIESKVEFVAVDMPHASKSTIQLMGVIAEFEADVISQRTKAALTEAKRRG
jgi:DNA invertase Pin-like site-specific DNA recombinase